MGRNTHKSKRVKRESTWTRITDDLICEILLKLPPESIRQCLTVCKSWLKIIETPDFKARTNTIDNRLILVPGGLNRDKLYNIVFPYWPNNPNVASVKELQHPCGNKQVNIVGTCYGLVCLENLPGFNYWDSSDTIHYTLWNPSTGIHRMVRHISSNISEGMSYFGYDHVKDDYHVIRVLKQGSIYVCDGLGKIHLYSLKNDSWTKIPYQNKWDINAKNGICISTTLYLLSNCKTKIIAFDISTKRFRSVKLSPHIKLSPLIVLGKLHGRLTIMEQGSYVRKNSKTKHVIWSLMNDDAGRGRKEALWETIEIETSVPIYLKKVLQVAATEERLLVLGRTESWDSVMLWCDLKNNSTTHITSESPHEDMVDSEACVCLSTIASLNQYGLAASP